MQMTLLLLTIYVSFGLLYCLWAWQSWWRFSDIAVADWVKGSVCLMLIFGPLRVLHWFFRLVTRDRIALRVAQMKLSWLEKGYFSQKGLVFDEPTIRPDPIGAENPLQAFADAFKVR